MKQNGSGQPGSGEADWLRQLAAVLPGDVVDVWMEGTYVVKTVYLCREVVADRTFEWRWLFLDDGSLIEVSLDGFYRYRQHHTINQGTDLYEALVAQDGALVRFEERVRAGTSGRRPVHVTIEGRQYRLGSTGTVGVQRLGDEPDLVPWRSLNADPEQNVYFGLVETDDEQNVGLGLWTVHLSLSFGGPLDPAAITAVYRK